MSQEIRYCVGCGMRVLAEDYARKAAFREGSVPFCSGCFLQRLAPRSASIRKLLESHALLRRLAQIRAP